MIKTIDIHCPRKQNIINEGKIIPYICDNCFQRFECDFYKNEKDKPQVIKDMENKDNKTTQQNRFNRYYR